MKCIKVSTKYLKGGDILNTVGMVFQQGQPVKSTNSNIMEFSFGEGSTAFRDILLTKQNTKQQADGEDFADLAELPVHILREIYEQLASSEQVNKTSLDHLTAEDLLSSIEELLSSEGEHVIFSLDQLLYDMQISKQDLNPPVINGSKVEAQEQYNLDKLYAQIELLLTANENVLEVPAEILTSLVDQVNATHSDEGILLLQELVEELVSSGQLEEDSTVLFLDTPDKGEFIQLSTQIEALLGNLGSEQRVLKVSPEMIQSLIDQTKSLNPEEGKILLEEILNELGSSRQFAQLYAQAESLLANLSDSQEIVKISPKILALLEKWTALDNTFNQQVNGQMSQVENESDELAIWKKLVVAYQKRSELANNQRYYKNAEVTSKDVAKWIHSGLNTQQTLETTSATQQANVANLPISRIEQHVIHINQTETSEPASKQFIDQFQSAMKTSRFLSMNNGVNQLSIALRPDNLGEMMVRLTEVNGEMTLKIIVSSQSTRQMLESNLHQLKNMFSPHQVVIEEQEIDLQETQSNNEEQAFDERDEDHSEQSHQESLKDVDDDVETSFHDLLMNEKV